jgi:hypothetical protein
MIFYYKRKAPVSRGNRRRGRDGGLWGESHRAGARGMAPKVKELIEVERRSEMNVSGLRKRLRVLGNESWESRHIISLLGLYVSKNLQIQYILFEPKVKHF